MNFLLLTLLTGGKEQILINMSQVTDISPLPKGGCCVSFATKDEAYYQISESLQEIHERIKSLSSSNQ